ncbi:hypothetical protein G9F32_12985 [Acinetobacter sp. 194]|uniref:hypothetical protein n=1 Tax=Acinetobacter shaoyimingii TaxID=2715164 RepID=UPI00140A5FF2|nr:hypothetical protein [Acinetobacter shaoyimingii]NHB58924.1 hypothetical protein [Acinetobacter shaoyimingii]
MKNNKLKIWGIVIVLLSLIGVVGAVAYFYIYPKSKKTEQEVTPKISRSEIEISLKPDVEANEIETEMATAEVEKLDQNEGWLPIESLFDENGLLKEKYYSQKPEDSNIDKLPYTLNKISDFKSRAETHHVNDYEGENGKFKDQCFGYCIMVKDKLLASVEAIVFTGAFIAKDYLIEVIGHKGSGAYMPVNYMFIKINKKGNAEVISDDHDSYNDQLARINHSGLEIDLKPFRKLQYFLLMNENGLSVSMKKPKRQEIKPNQCKEYYEGTLEACPMLHGCEAEVVVQSLARAYAGDVGFSYHDPNIDEKIFNQVCFKVCRGEEVNYQEFEDMLCKAS